MKLSITKGLTYLINLCVMIFSVGCSSLLYSPRVPKVKFYDPSQVGLKQEEIEFKSADGLGIHGWWFSATTEEARGTVVFFHGNGENLTSHFANLSWLPKEGYNYFIFDYPGYGVSEGEPTTENTVAAGVAALKWVHQNKDSRGLFVYAHSLGGAIGHRAVLDCKEEVPIKSLVLDGTFLSYRTVAKRKAEQSWLLWLFQPLAWLVMSDTYAPKDVVDKRPPIPLLVIHGTLDKVVPPDLGQDLYDRSPGPKELWFIPEEHHGDLFWIENFKYRTRLLDYWTKL